MSISFMELFPAQNLIFAIDINFLNYSGLKRGQ